MAADAYWALYPRVSSAQQKDNWSVKDQLALARLGKERGVGVVLYDGDLGISAETIDHRPDMRALLADLAKGRISKPLDVDGNAVPPGATLVGILCADWNRLSRDQDLVDSLVIKKTCKDAGALVVTPTKTYDFERDSDDLLAHFEAIFAANQNKARSRVTTRAQYGIAAEGEWPGGQIPYGYRLNRNRPHRDGRLRGRLEIDSEEAEVVRLCFELYAHGVVGEDGRWHPLSQKGVAAELNRRGYRFREREYRDPAERLRKGRSPGGGRRAWGPMDVMRVVKSRRYVGYTGWGQHQTSRHARDLGPAEAFDEAKRIVGMGLFLRAQAVREERRRQPARLGCPTRPLQGLLRCPHCQSRTVSNNQSARGGSRERVVVYQCLAFRHYGASPDGGCPEGGYSVCQHLALPVIDGLVLALFDRLEVQRQLDEAVAEARARDSAGQDAALREALDRNAFEKQNLLDAVAARLYTHAEIRHKKDELDAEEERLKKRLEGLRLERASGDDLRRTAEALRGQPLRATLGRMAANDPARYRQVVGLFLEAVTLEGEGPSRARRVWVSEAHPPVLTPAARRLVDSRTAQPDSTSDTSVLTQGAKVRGPSGGLLGEALALLAAPAP